MGKQVVGTAPKDDHLSLFARTGGVPQPANKSAALHKNPAPPKSPGLGFVRGGTSCQAALPPPRCGAEQFSLCSEGEVPLLQVI